MVTKAISREIRLILQEFQSELLSIYGARFKRLILYGSHSRGEATEDSDIDVVAVIEGVQNPLSELEMLSKTISQISLKYDTLISLYPISPKDFEERNSPLFLNVRREGVSL
jgi:predicted nucleotidyltransferase